VFRKYAGDHYYSYMRGSSPGLNAPDFFSYTLKLSAYHLTICVNNETRKSLFHLENSEFLIMPYKVIAKHFYQHFTIFSFLHTPDTTKDPVTNKPLITQSPPPDLRPIWKKQYSWHGPPHALSLLPYRYK